MAEYLIQSESLDDIADAINAKTGGSSAMTPAQMVTAIGSISGGSVPRVVSVDTYTQVEDWLSDSQGNTLNFCKTYLDYDNHPTTFKIAYITNNNASTYKASVFWVYPIGSTTSQGNGTFSRAYPSRAISSSASFWISAGAQITVITLESIVRNSGEAV